MESKKDFGSLVLPKVLGHLIMSYITHFTSPDNPSLDREKNPDTIDAFLSLFPGPLPLEVEFTQMRYTTEKENTI